MAKKDTISNRVLRPKDAKVIIKRCFDVQRPLMLWGPPGIGKSDLIATIGKDTNRPVIDLRLLLMEPTDLKGIPYYNPDTKTMMWSPSDELPKNGVGLDDAILFLDEINAAPPSVQAAAYQLILNRKVGQYTLPDGVSIIAAGNRESDKGVTFRMPTPLANRFIHIEMEHNFEDWQKWAVNANVHSDVVGFLTHTKQYLFNFDPKSPDKAFATPRTWDFVSQVLDDTLPDSMNETLVAGSVGEGIAIEFMQHRRVASKMPKPEDVLSGAVKDLKVKEISAKWSLTISLCYTLKEMCSKAQDETEKAYGVKEWHENVDYFFKFMMDNFEAEMVILGAKTALRDYELPIQHRMLKHFNAFYEEYGAYVLED